MSKDTQPIFKEILPGMIYEHCHGRRYQINAVFKGFFERIDKEVDNTSIFWDATGYEKTNEVRKVKKIISDSPESQTIIEYTQLEGGFFPAGTKWLRLKDDFEGEAGGVKIFELVNIK